MEVRQGDHTATLEDGVFVSDDESFALWLNTAFIGGDVPTMLACGLEVDGERKPTLAELESLMVHKVIIPDSAA